MPAASFWFSGAPLYFAGSFAFAIVVGLIGIKSMISRRLFAFMMAVALVLTVLAWRTAAKQEEASAQQEASNTELKNTLNKIANSANVDPNQSAETLANKIIEKIRPLADQVDKLTNPPRDPLGIYQNQKKIGVAEGDTHRNSGVLNFQTIETTEPLSRGAEFEFGKFRLRFGNAGIASSGSMPGGIKGFTYRMVTTEIIGTL